MIATMNLTLRVNGDRLNRHLNRLAEIGQQRDGSICRLAFSPEDIQARQLVHSWMLEAGMTVRVDAAGNLIGTYEGTQAGAAALATGSHIDTVPSGGKYDGALGVIAGIEVVRVLHERNLRLTHPVEVIAFADEENTMIGCKAMAGTLATYPDKGAGTPMPAYLKAVGGDWSKLATARRTRTDMAAYVELHVEQGGVLEDEAKQIGVVQGIVGTNRYGVSIIGRPNHAGTTPMHLRKDALVAAAQVVLAVQNLALNSPGQQVATVGSLNVSPNAANIVPGQVELTIDMRDLSRPHLDQLIKQLNSQLQVIAHTSQTEITLTPILQVEPTLATETIQAVIAQTCERFRLSYCHLPSRAGHDAQEVGRFTDMGMIFVPSQAGLSHSADEYTSPEQCTQGANVLLQTLLHLDQIYPVCE
jgi:N-carbamoyl-L-amino-acid hydrolase